jgi:hypothetical protein
MEDAYWRDHFKRMSPTIDLLLYTYDGLFIQPIAWL